MTEAMPRQSQNLFISYRRPLPQSKVSLATDLVAPLQRQWLDRGRVILDAEIVRERSFATDLVDNSLNHSIAVLVAVDDAWLEAANLARLQIEGDWVCFEIRYAFDWGLLVLPVVHEERLADFRRAILPADISKIQAPAHGAFVLDPRRSMAENVARLAAVLETRLHGHERRPSSLSATDRHNLPKKQSADEVEHQLGNLSAVQWVLRFIDRGNEIVQFAFWVLLAACLLSWLGGVLAIPLVVVACLCGLAWRRGPQVRAWYLQRKLP